MVYGHSELLAYISVYYLYAAAGYNYPGRYPHGSGPDDILLEGPGGAPTGLSDGHQGSRPPYLQLPEKD